MQDNSVRVDVIIFSPKENYKPIILGKNGSLIKKIGTLVRKELIREFKVEFHLFLYVKVSKNIEQTNIKD